MKFKIEDYTVVPAANRTQAAINAENAARNLAMAKEIEENAKRNVRQGFVNVVLAILNIFSALVNFGTILWFVETHR